jgi:hypothetical protein
MRDFRFEIDIDHRQVRRRQSPAFALRIDRNWKPGTLLGVYGNDDGGKDRAMPWTHNDAETHTHKATTPALKELWAKVANESLDRTGDEGRAIREANAVIARQAESR